MPYTTPPDFVAGTIVTEAQLDTLSDDIVFLANPPKCRVYNSAAISIATSGVAQAVTFNSERWDTDTMHSTVSNTDRVTCTTAGTYTVGYAAEFAANATGNRQAYLEKFNSAGVSQGTYGAQHVVNIGGSDPVQMLVGGVDIDLAAGDFVRLYVKQTSGGALNLNANVKYSPEMWARWVSF